MKKYFIQWSGSARSLSWTILIQHVHTQVQRHLSLMGLSNDPFCSYCKEVVESASHFLCHCNYFAALRTTVWGKPSLHPTDIDSTTVGDTVSKVYQEISQILIKYPVTTGISQGMADEPTLRSKSTGRCNKCPAPFGPGTWNFTFCWTTYHHCI